MEQQQVQDIVDQIFGLYEALGGEEYGESVSMTMHMMQCAQLAQQAGEADEVVLAAFLHDIGHFLEGDEKMDIYGTQNHDDLGGRFLVDLGFPQRMADLVSSHVAAKKYLVYAEPAYYDALSEVSKITLEFQGGKMAAEEAAEFEKDPLLPLYVKIRKWDDLGKDADKPVLTEEIQLMKAMTYRYLSGLGQS
ncbi:putative nucleotidyltransferase with HDIG domain [Pedobacter cryoconitis]|uniref:Putative nucleotidyltransferase with HDIG domain n=1 Tax=Pedobacter cryoconitis TaxID=188932 RepID=A0A7W8YPN1_9SPHI|nr:HD domain-containing protein [Pedobacter cryoconitis]MBB5619527.1 putative nucleotidyltransferase with HDIG domain [Pedobacter cryoconitis]